MKHQKLNELSATVLSAMLESGDCTAVQVAQACLERVQARDADVKAWAYIDPDAVLEQAKVRDREARRGPLHGIPVGVKDIMHTFDMPTEYASPIYRGNRTREDAACVAMLRDAGCVIMGKTETMEFAVYNPARTHNPHNFAHTPGGSSSGSAAATADFMVPLALGTQTGGSIIRPASYCGVVGYKPSYGLINRAGVKAVSDSLDTVGVLARTVGDAALIASALIGWKGVDLYSDSDQLRIGLCRSPAAKFAEASTLAAVEETAARLGKARCSIREVVLSGPFDLALDAQASVNLYEARRSLSFERINHPEQISKVLTARFEQGEKIKLYDYLAAQAVLNECRERLAEVFEDVDVLIEPSSTGEAPRGLENPGDSAFNRMWTALRVPCLSLPVLRGPSALPLGLQVIGPINSDKITVQVADQIGMRLQ
ncbi:MAG: amidase [Burkholderiales bacterium]